MCACDMLVGANGRGHRMLYLVLLVATTGVVWNFDKRGIEQHQDGWESCIVLDLGIGETGI